MAKKAIKDMIRGDKFLCGNTQCMKIKPDDLMIVNEVAHINLLTGEMMFISDIKPDDEFEYFGRLPSPDFYKSPWGSICHES